MLLKAKIKQYQVKIGIGLLLGGLPQDKTALEYLAGHPERDGSLAASEMLADNAEELEEIEEKRSNKCIFRRTPDGKPAVDEHHVRAFVRDVLKKLELNKKAPWKGFWMSVHTVPMLIPVEGEEIIESRAFKAGFPNPANIVVVHEAVKNATLRFTLEIHGDNGEKASIEDLHYIFEYGGRYVGFGPAKTKSMSETPYGIFTCHNLVPSPE